MLPPAGKLIGEKRRRSKTAAKAKVTLVKQQTMVQESISVVIGRRHLLVSPVCSTVVAMEHFWPVWCILQF